MSNSLTINFTNNSNGVFYPNQVVSGKKMEKKLRLNGISLISALGSVELKVVETIKKARGKKKKKSLKMSRKSSRVV